MFTSEKEQELDELTKVFEDLANQSLNERRYKEVIDELDLAQTELKQIRKECRLLLRNELAVEYLVSNFTTGRLTIKAKIRALLLRRIMRCSSTISKFLEAHPDIYVYKFPDVQLFNHTFPLGHYYSKYLASRHLSDPVDTIKVLDTLDDKIQEFQEKINQEGIK